MLIRQISIFLENRPGRFAEMTRLLGNNGINMKSFTVSESDDFGLARILVSREETDRAYELLKANHYAVSINHVIYKQVSDAPGAMAEILDRLSQSDINIDYMYAFSEESEGRSHIIFRVDNVELADQVISDL